MSQFCILFSLILDNETRPGPIIALLQLTVQYSVYWVFQQGSSSSCNELAYYYCGGSSNTVYYQWEPPLVRNFTFIDQNCVFLSFLKLWILNKHIYINIISFNDVYYFILSIGIDCFIDKHFIY
jgi:hypothetical protein